MNNEVASPALPRSLVFVRHEDGRVTTIGVLNVNSRLDENECKDALKAATTHWVTTTEDGKRLWTYSGGDLNIGDLASSSAFDDEEFLAALSERGVEFVDCRVNGCEEAFSFDEVLAKAGDLDEELQ